jgi:hypothetical protein
MSSKATRRRPVDWLRETKAVTPLAPVPETGEAAETYPFGL